MSIFRFAFRALSRAWTPIKTSAGPVDLGCGWLHSADRNPWARIAEESGFRSIVAQLPGASNFATSGFQKPNEEDARRAFALLEQPSCDVSPPASDKRRTRWNLTDRGQPICKP